MSGKRNGNWVVLVILGAVLAVSLTAWLIFMRVEAAKGQPLPEAAADSAP